MPSKKPVLDRKVLAQHGIVYSEDVYSPLGSACPLPAHVESLREALLDFDRLIPEILKPVFESERQLLRIDSADESVACNVLPPASTYVPRPDHMERATIAEIVRAEDEIEEYRNLARKFRAYTASKVSDATWTHLLHSNIFKRFAATDTFHKKHE
jgi:hypothetical protein